MESISICPQTIFRFDIDSALIADTLTKARKLDFAPNNTNYRSVNSYLFKQPEFAELGSRVQECIDEVNEHVYGLEQIRVTQSWCNRAAKGMWHHLHTHSNSLLSGTIYLTPSDADTWISIDNIWQPGRGKLYPVFDLGQKVNENLALVHKEPTTVGTLLLFPSTLYHSVDGNNNDHERFTIAFNTFVAGKFGVEWELNELIL